MDGRTSWRGGFQSAVGCGVIGLSDGGAGGLAGGVDLPACVTVSRRRAHCALTEPPEGGFSGIVRFIAKHPRRTVVPKFSGVLLEPAFAVLVFAVLTTALTLLSHQQDDQARMLSEQAVDRSIASVGAEVHTIATEGAPVPQPLAPQNPFSKAFASGARTMFDLSKKPSLTNDPNSFAIFLFGHGSSETASARDLRASADYHAAESGALATGTVLLILAIAVATAAHELSALRSWLLGFAWAGAALAIITVFWLYP